MANNGGEVENSIARRNLDFTFEKEIEEEKKEDNDNV